jgi:hypothetical protein
VLLEVPFDALDVNGQASEIAAVGETTDWILGTALAYMRSTGVYTLLPTPGGIIPPTPPTSGYVLTANGAGGVSWQPVTATAIATPVAYVAPTITTESAVTISDGSGGRTGSGQLLEIFDHLGAPIFAVGPTGGPSVFGDHMRAAQGVFGPFISLDGTTNPASLQFPGGNRMWMASGLPSSYGFATYTTGDIYFRTDTPTTANQRMAICTGGGTGGAATFLWLL